MTEGQIKEGESLKLSVGQKKVKFSVCQSCNGWVRLAALDYFNSNIKARNEFMKEVLKHNLSVREMSLTEWEKTDIEMCECNTQTPKQ